ncbi:MAG: 4'-phosphopantetheinyl transferase superfamily protein [Clostridia bacterium]|nr:4'-phosphopantetheinyl transferase superfamily protein [Clostridia bacterium]
MLILHYKHLSPLPHNRCALHEAQSEAAHMLLEEVVQALHLPPSLIAKTEKGRPYFKALPTIDFSLAHTDGFAVCALQKCDNGTPPRVGVDAEAKTQYSDAKIKQFSLRFFGKHEQDYIEHAADRQAAFTEVFVRKEAYAKYCGDGLGAHLSKTDTMAPQFEQSNDVRFYSYLQKNIFISLCLSQECNEKPTFL